MEECFALALKAQGRTSPNPMVGSVVLDQSGGVVGRGYHERAGERHAEIVALDQAGDRARGGTLYVSLEPCCHHGRTAPCTERVIASGVKRVVAAQVDPNPKVAGKGMEAITVAGIETDVGLLQDEAEWINRGFLKRIRRGLPWLCLKIATTLDGRIADRTGNSRWVSGVESRKRVHELRDKLDAVMVGSNTLLHDDPELNVRDVPGRDPIRVVIDKSLRFSQESRFASTKTDAQTIVLCGTDVTRERMENLPPNFQCICVAEDANGRIKLTLALHQLADRGINTILCEGGGQLASSLLSQSLVDELYWIVAPMVLGDPQARPAVDNGGTAVTMGDALRFQRLDSFSCGDDQWLHLRRSVGAQESSLLRSGSAGDPPASV
jgi:diaminohydroxyphosphoribosylaminopyrimidine deaminase/5-amino-6-(5-phosphoribosylamino)uracil reductase